ncbi:MAG: glutamate--tRNA ligase [Candidatus Aminicenantales bacterium]
MNKVRVRFAPSPTGYLHVGNARTALFNWLFAKKNKGAFVLRIEDTDVERSKEEYEKRLVKDLRWLGLDWDEGPDVGGRYGPYRQSQRLSIYRKFTRQLLKEGRAYHCFCSPEELRAEREKALASEKMPIYSGKCRFLSPDEVRARIKAGKKAVVRLRTDEKGLLSYQDMIRGQLSFDLALLGDFILVRSNGLPAYNYAVVIDDHLMGITHVIRGEDHISNTPRQILVYKAFSWELPVFAHLPMVMGKDNSRLSKRHGATAVDQFEKEGYLSSALFNYLALLGWAPQDGNEVLSREELIQLFNLEKVSRSSAIFDYEKLKWLNRQHIERLAARELAVKAYPFLRDAGLLPSKMTDAHWRWLEMAVESLAERVDLLSELPREFSFLFDFSLQSLSEEEKAVLKSKSGARIVRLFGEKISRVMTFNYEIFASLTKEIQQETGVRGKELFHPLRIALTARTSGLELARFIPLVEEGSLLSLPRQMKNCSQRIKEVLSFLPEKPS